ncbi:MAG TPA: threonine--tRNA ligase, partial [Capsulimonadaceae bacterium]|nr:threonine--tRNA ligase [Capsulimonadaceae bacterium]
MMKTNAKTLASEERFIPSGYDKGLYRIRHSCAHILAQAVLEKFPDAKLGIGPPIENGFYYDFDLPAALSEDDLTEIEQIMKRIIREGHDFVRDEPGREALRELFAGQPYKRELIEAISSQGLDENGEPTDSGAALSTYRQDKLVDLCRGPHVMNTREIDPDAVHLLSVAGAYWRGDSKGPMLQRIYGTAWATPSELEAHLARLEEGKRRDHRVIGRNLDLFSTSEAVGPGLVLWHPKAAMVRYLAERFSQEAHVLNGYQWVYTPHIGRAGLWQTSGHLDFYKDSM